MVKKYFFILYLVLLHSACVAAAPTVDVPAHTESVVDIADGYGGWGYVADKLITDGIPQGLVRAVYEDGSVVPHFDFVPFKLRPKETSAMYKGFQTASIKKLAYSCYERHKDAFDDASQHYGIPALLMAAFITVETYCGKHFGKELVVNRLSRVASTVVEANVERNLEEVKKEFPNATLEDVRLRAKYLEQVFYPQLKALFEGHIRGDVDIFELRGSIAGAFGMPQFLPKTYLDYGVDGDRNGHVDLFNPRDAIFSVGNFLRMHGWKKGLTVKEKREIIWHYNRSEPYIDTILFLSNL